MDVVADSVNVTTYFNLRLAADGTAATGLTIADLDLQYVRSGETPVAKVDAVALAATNTAHTDNRAIEIDGTDQPGLYRVDWPDAAFAAGVREVILTVKHTTTFIEHLRVNLTPVPADVSRVLSTTLTEGAAGRLAGGIVKWFNVASPTGTVNSVPDAVAGAAGGLVIAGSNAATTFATLTVSGAVAFQSTFAVTTSTSLAALSCTTLTASGAVAFQSTFAVTTSTSLAALSCTTLTASGAVAFQSTFAVTTSTSLAALSATTFSTSGTTTLNALTVTNAFTVSGATVLTGNVSMAAGLTVTQSSSNAAGVSITGNGSGAGLSITSGTTSGAAALLITGGGAQNHGVSITATGSRHGITITASTGQAISTVSGIILGSVSMTGGLVVDSLTVTNATTFSGAVSLGSTLGVTGAITATNASNNLTLGTFTVTTNAIAWNPGWDAEVESEATDALNAYDPPTNAEMEARTLVAASYATAANQATILTNIDALPTNAELATALAAADDAVLAAIAALNNLSAAQVNAEVVDVIRTDTNTEPGQGAPPATATLQVKVDYLYKMLRNKKDFNKDTGVRSLYNDAGNVVDQKATDSDDGTTYTKGELGAGP